MRLAAAWLILPVLFLPLACQREAPAPATQPASRPATAPATEPAATTRYVDVIHASYPKLATTQPLGVPVDLIDAGHYILPGPILICSRGDLWITRDDAPPMVEALKLAADQDVHIVPEAVVFVQWTTNDEGKWIARPVVKNGAGRFEWIDGAERRPTTTGRAYRWRDAIYFADGIIAVPTDRGVSMFTFTPAYAENYREILPGDAGASGGAATQGSTVPTTAPVAATIAPATTSTATTLASTAPASTAPATGLASAAAAGSGANLDTANPVQLVLDPTGLIAFSPWDGRRPGGRGAARFADGKWSDLNADNQWPEKIVHLVPLLDGSVLQVSRETVDGPVKLTLSTMGPASGSSVDEKAIGKLVDQLADDDPAKRSVAFNELTRYGPASWPVLEKLRNDAAPEASIRIEQLLANRLEPTLGGRKPVDGNLRIVGRFEDGGVLTFLRAGVSIPQEDKPPEVVKPAWVSMRPGRAIELLDPVLVKDADPTKERVFSFGEEWIISDTKDGPRRLLGNHVESMLHKDESAWADVIGSDRRGRWLFRKPGDESQTLILDPTLPDLTPKLPIWIMNIPQATSGWNKENYPVMKSGDPWALYEHNWKSLDPKKDDLIAELPKVAPPPPPPIAPKPIATTTTAPATTQSTTRASTMPATAEATTQEVLPPPILTDADGRRYFDGKRTLRVIDSTGRDITWTLPATAAGSNDVTLLRTADGLLFLFNQPGRIVRIKPTPEGAEPFVVEAIFTDRVPKPQHLRRIWLDPAGRICMAFDKNGLAVMFPQGRIPHEIMVLIPAKELE